MFASARSAAAAAPLASPSLRHVLEFTHTAHAHGPLVGLGIRVSPTMSSSSTSAGSASSNTTLHNMPAASGQPAMLNRPTLQRMQSSNMTIVPPRTPRLQATATLPPVFSPLLLTPMGNHSPLAEGYFSDANGQSENREAIASGSQSAINHAMHSHRFAAADNMRLTPRSTLVNNTAHATEVERIGLGIAGLSLNAVAPNRIVSEQILTDDSGSESESGSSMPIRTRKRMSTRLRRIRSSMRSFIVGSSNRNIDDGYNADAENDHHDVESSHGARRDTGLTLSRSSYMRRVRIPFYAPNGGASRL